MFVYLIVVRKFIKKAFLSSFIHEFYHRALQHSHDGTADNNNPGDHGVAQTFGAQPGLDYSMQRSPRDAMYSSHMVSSHIQSNFIIFLSKIHLCLLKFSFSTNTILIVKFLQ